MRLFAATAIASCYSAGAATPVPTPFPSYDPTPSPSISPSYSPAALPTSFPTPNGTGCTDLGGGWQYVYNDGGVCMQAFACGDNACDPSSCATDAIDYTAYSGGLITCDDTGYYSEGEFAGAMPTCWYEEPCGGWTLGSSYSYSFVWTSGSSYSYSFVSPPAPAEPSPYSFVWPSGSSYSYSYSFVWPSGSSYSYSYSFVPPPAPTTVPIPMPTAVPIPAPTAVPIPAPTISHRPTPPPSGAPMPAPTSTFAPTRFMPTSVPVPAPSGAPTPVPTPSPSSPFPTPVPTPSPTRTPVVSVTLVMFGLECDAFNATVFKLAFDTVVENATFSDEVCTDVMTDTISVNQHVTVPLFLVTRHDVVNVHEYVLNVINASVSDNSLEEAIVFIATQLGARRLGERGDGALRRLGMSSDSFSVKSVSVDTFSPTPAPSGLPTPAPSPSPTMVPTAPIPAPAVVPPPSSAPTPAPTPAPTMVAPTGTSMRATGGDIPVVVWILVVVIILLLSFALGFRLMAGGGAASKESAAPTAVPAPATQDTGLLLTEPATPQDAQNEIQISRDGPTGGGESGRMVPFWSGGGGGEGYFDLYGCACVPADAAEPSLGLGDSSEC